MECTKGEWQRRGWLIVDTEEVLIADCRKREPSSVFESYNSNITTPGEQTTANAQRIVKAVNCHDDLVGALKFFMNQLEPWEKLYPGLKQWTLLAKETGAKTLSKTEAL